MALTLTPAARAEPSAPQMTLKPEVLPKLTLDTAEQIRLTFGEPPWGTIGKSVYERTYSRVKEDGTKEDWADTILRVVDGNLGYVDPTHHLEGEREYLIEKFYNMQMLPAGRHLWSTGASGINATANCFVAPWDESISTHFCWVFEHLMTGSGVGSNYSCFLIDSMPAITSKVDLKIRVDESHNDFDEIRPDNAKTAAYDVVYYVEDSREGWVKALQILLEAAVKPTAIGRIIFDVSMVRPRGEPIRGFGGIASGPGPLADSLRSIADILNSRLTHGTHKLTPIDCMNIDHEIARCVVAGNVRRSARMSVLNWDDPYIEDFLDCKSDHQHNWTTNISVGIDSHFLDEVADPHSLAHAIHNRVIQGMLHNGEPGYLNLELANEGKSSKLYATNPCGEQFLEQGSACTLGHINLSAWDGNQLELEEAFAMMARFVLRATQRDYLDEWEANATREYRRIGVGFFGLQEYAAQLGIKYSDMPDSSLIKLNLSKFYNAVRSTADDLADALGWNRPADVTTVAPTGSIAILAGKSTGCEPILYPYYNRLVRFASSDESLKEHAANGLKMEPCIYADQTTVVYFPTRDSILDSVEEALVESSSEMSVEDHLRVQDLLQQYYVDNAISKTIGIKSDVEFEYLSNLILEYMPRLKGVTVFPDTSRPQAPFEPLSKEEFEASMVQSVGSFIENDCGPLGCPIR